VRSEVNGLRSEVTTSSLKPRTHFQPPTILGPASSPNLHRYSVLDNLACIHTDPHQSDRANSLTIQRLMTEPPGLSLAPPARRNCWEEPYGRNLGDRSRFRVSEDSKLFHLNLNLNLNLSNRSFLITVLCQTRPSAEREVPAADHFLVAH
jgi:hypothetical protein